ncbi:uncharacterized protein LOC124797977 isoform X1 [Schistocerca piceifrons]|uniref:uncharacterized protein LOC124797977 isoform X1 n=1 Tax=Schistocerca piceifrons TaxID=274613 RepID=UPI001F5E47E3|nr:uncharacterized protein LOC124797977 isoform X1 [Schistocerca piceifrons]XP_047117107.1 uncharacterized protein LOC124797977 isoform X1 [Schistocerca piceifrons]
MEKCECCNILVPAKEFTKHLQDKRHRLREKRFNEMIQNSVFISCLPGGVDQGMLIEALSRFGKVRTCSIFQRSNNAVAEFEQREAARKCLQEPVYIGQTLLKMAPRRKPKPKADPAPVPDSDVDPTELISILEGAHSNGVRDVDALIDLAVQTVRLQDPERNRKLLMLQRDLEECISELVPGCQAHQFGSSVTGVPLRGSDTDIVMILPEIAARNFDGPQIVRRVRKLLWTRHRKFGSIVAIPEARIPIVKIIHIPTGIACDISFQGQGCVLKSKQLSHVLDMDFRIRPLIIFLKYWAKCHNIISLSRFSSYAATLMVVFFLQQLPEPILPPIQKILHPDPGNPCMTTRNTDSLSKLVEEYFRYYSETDLTYQVICPWVGHLVPCEAFSETLKVTIPDEVKHIRNLLSMHNNSLEINTPLVVQDPYEMNRNVTERVKDKDFTFFRLCCGEAVKILREGAPALLFKDLCVPREVDDSTTLSADLFLKPEYLGAVDIAAESARQMLFARWTHAVVALVPEFLTRFVRLKVEPVDDTRGPVSVEDCMITKCLPRSWKCSGKPVLHTWNMRKKAATKHKLDPKLPMMERETLISQHLEQEPSEVENASFIVRIIAGSKKESVRCCLIAHTADAALYHIIARKLLSLIPLWLNTAFVSRTALNYISDFSLSTNTDAGSALPANANVCGNTEESSAAEIVLEKGAPALLFKDLCVPMEVDDSTTLSADLFLKPEYLGAVDIAAESARQMLFARWTHAVVALVPEFLTRFVRLKVEPVDDTRGPVSVEDCMITKCLPRSWKCSGKPVLHTWNMRKKAATKHKLDPKLPMMERETLISQHLEQEPSEVENASFIVRIIAGSKKESVRCCLIAHTADAALYHIIARKLLSLIPLWLNTAFVSRTALNYISDFSLSTNTDAGSALPANANVCGNTEESSAAEIVLEKGNTDKQDDDLSS